MKPIYRLQASAYVKIKGDKKFKRITRSFQLPDNTVSALSAESLQTFAKALFEAKYGSDKVTCVQWAEVQKGVILDDVELWA